MNLPNKLTMLRMALIPVFVLAFYIPGRYAFWIAAIVFVAAFVTDMLDGRIARKRKQVTDFGKLMDPIADKLLTAAALIMLTANAKLSPIVVIIIISREFLVSGLRLVVADKGVVVPANWLGKAKTVCQFIMLVLLLIRPAVEAVCGGAASWLIGIFVAIATLLTVWSGYEYIRAYWRYIDFRK